MNKIHLKPPTLIPKPLYAPREPVLKRIRYKRILINIITVIFSVIISLYPVTETSLLHDSTDTGNYLQAALRRMRRSTPVTPVGDVTCCNPAIGGRMHRIRIRNWLPVSGSTPAVDSRHFNHRNKLAYHGEDGLYIYIYIYVKWEIERERERERERCGH